MQDVEATLRITYEELNKLGFENSLDYCRQLIKDGCDSEETLEVYRGDMLCITNHNIGESAKWVAEGNNYRKHRPRSVGEPH